MTSIELEEQLRDAKKQLADQKYALDQSAIVAITNAQGVIVYVNDKFCDISKYSREELIGKTHRIVNSGVHHPEYFVDMWRTIVAGQVWSGEICNRTKNGDLYWVYTTIVPFVGHNGRPYQYIAIRFDITHKKQTEVELEDEKERLIQSDKMASLGVLASGIAHEIGNPLGALRGRLEMLEMAAAKGPVDQEFLQERIQKMIPLVDRMTKIIRGFKAYARDGSQDPKENFDLTELVIDIVEMSREKCKRLGIDLQVEGLDEKVFVFGRETEIGQVIVNLFNNACDVVVDHEKPFVKIGLEEAENDVRLRVMDSGGGIPDAVAKKIFDPFYTTKGVGKGTGLGLSISRSLVEGHGGQLELVTGSPNTTFELTLPKS